MEKFIHGIFEYNVSSKEHELKKNAANSKNTTNTFETYLMQWQIQGGPKSFIMPIARSFI